MERIKAKKILVIFPQDYSLKDAYDKVMSWGPDDGEINWGLVNGRPYIYAVKNSKFSIRLSNSLKKEGIEILSGVNIIRIPTLNNPPLGDTQYHPNNIPQNPTISPEFKDEVKEMRNEIKELKELIVQLLKRKEPVATVERAGSGIGVDDRDIETSITKEVRSAGQEMTPKDMVDRSVSAARHADMQSIGTYPKSKSPPRVASVYCGLSPPYSSK